MDGMKTPRSPFRPPARIDQRWCAVHEHAMGSRIPQAREWNKHVPCDVRPLAALTDELRPIDLDAARPVSGPPDTPRAVLHQIRALLLFACFALAASFMLLAALTYHTYRVPPIVEPSTVPVGVQLIIPAEVDPATEAIAHLVMADGSERDVTPGLYRGTDIIAAYLQVTAGDDGTTGCRILVNNARVSEERAFAGETVMCSWSAAP